MLCGYVKEELLRVYARCGVLVLNVLYVSEYCVHIWRMFVLPSDFMILLSLVGLRFTRYMLLKYENDDIGVCNAPIFACL